MGVELYFILLRPPLLPEDIRYMVLPAAQLDTLRPRLELWLAHVFCVMGGYVLATGVLTVTLAAMAFRAHQNGAAIGALIGGAASIGWMAAVNFMIDSDFKWVLLGMALLWALSLVLFWFEREGLYLPPYSPDLNPIELAFAKFKNGLRKAAERTVDDLWRRIGTLINDFSPQECQNYFCHDGYASS